MPSAADTDMRPDGRGRVLFLAWTWVDLYITPVIEDVNRA